MQRVSGVEGKLFAEFHVDMAGFRVGVDASDCYLVNVGLRQDCVMSPWLFIVFI